MRGLRHGPVGAGGLEQARHLVDVEVDEIPQVGHQIAVGHEPEVEVVLVAVHRDVESDTVRDGRHRDVVVELGAGEVERLTRARHVRDHDVDRQAQTVRQARLEADGRGRHHR